MEVIMNLNEVEYIDDPYYEERRKMITDEIKIEFHERDLSYYGVDMIVSLENNQLGYAFVIRKDEKFITYTSDSTFIYRHDEVIEALENVINKMGLEDRINFDRGMGVFVYNIWENYYLD